MYKTPEQIIAALEAAKVYDFTVQWWLRRLDRALARACASYLLPTDGRQ